MEYRTNHTFHIGAQHHSLGKPCQDYALSGTLSGSIAYAIVSDGCSSGGETDIGARIVALATKRALEENAYLPGLTVERVNVVRDAYMDVYRRTLGLEHRDLLATCLWTLFTPSCLLIHATGDGAMALIYEDGTEVYETSWADNKPYYPAYRLGGIDNSFITAHQNTKLPFSVKTTRMDARGESLIDGYTVEQGMGGFTLDLANKDNSLSRERLKGVALGTDGTTQVDSFDTLATIRELTSFKSTQGDYLVRRMNRFLSESKKIGRGPIDDIACATILFTPTEGG
jgi:hypothetical protein